jgi:hypothetical protein
MLYLAQLTEESENMVMVSNFDGFVYIIHSTSVKKINRVSGVAQAERMTAYQA